VIYSYNKSQQDALFLNFILVNNSTCFETNLLSIIRILNAILISIVICPKYKQYIVKHNSSNDFIKLYFLHCFVQRHVSALVMSHLQMSLNETV